MDRLVARQYRSRLRLISQFITDVLVANGATHVNSTISGVETFSERPFLLPSSNQTHLLSPPPGQKTIDGRFSKASSEESLTTSTQTTLRAPPRSPQSTLSISDTASTPSSQSLKSRRQVGDDSGQEMLSQTPTRPTIVTGDLRRDIELMQKEVGRQSFDEVGETHGVPILSSAAARTKCGVVPSTFGLVPGRGGTGGTMGETPSL